jgi:hypothetical protein
MRSCRTGKLARLPTRLTFLMIMLHGSGIPAIWSSALLLMYSLLIRNKEDGYEIHVMSDP